MSYLEYLLLSIFFVSSFFIFYINFTSYSLMLFFLLYLFASLVFLSSGAEIIALFLILVYVGGVLVLFMFSLLFYETEKGYYFFYKNNFIYYNLIKSPIFYCVNFSLFIIFFYSLCQHLDPYFVYYKLIVLNKSEIFIVSLKKLLWLYNVNSGEILGFSGLSYINFFSAIYVSYFFSTIVVFLIFLLALFGVIAVLSKKYDYYSHLKRFKNIKLYSDISYIILLDWTCLLDNNPLFIVYTLLIIPFIFIFIRFSFSFIKFLLVVEIIVLIIMVSLISLSYFSSDLVPWVLMISLLGIYASETALALSLYISYKSEKRLIFYQK